jgi:hypothetical protein
MERMEGEAGMFMLVQLLFFSFFDIHTFVDMVGRSPCSLRCSGFCF